MKLRKKTRAFGWMGFGSSPILSMEGINLFATSASSNRKTSKTLIPPDWQA
jgi:hypothetical protein